MLPRSFWKTQQSCVATAVSRRAIAAYGGLFAGRFAPAKRALDFGGDALRSPRSQPKRFTTTLARGAAKALYQIRCHDSAYPASICSASAVPRRERATQSRQTNFRAAGARRRSRSRRATPPSLRASTRRKFSTMTGYKRSTLVSYRLRSSAKSFVHVAVELRPHAE